MKKPKENTVCTTRILLAVAVVGFLLVAFGSAVLAAPSGTTALSPRELLLFDPFALRTIVVGAEPSSGGAQATSVVLVSRQPIRTGYALPVRSAFRPVW